MKIAIRNMLATALCASVLALASGCANKYARNHMAADQSCAETPVVAVMPFQGVSESPGSGLIVADVLANELYALGGFILVTPEELAARASKREGEVLSPAETGRMVGARYIITGRVTEYTYKSGVGEQPAVGITARLIECDTGRVKWSATRARTGSAAWFQEDSLGLLTSRLCRDLALSVKGQALEYGVGNRSDDFYADQHPVVKEPAPPKPEPDAGATPQPAAAEEPPPVAALDSSDAAMQVPAVEAWDFPADGIRLSSLPVAVPLPVDGGEWQYYAQR